MDIFELCDIIRQTGYELHVYLGHGHLEKVYENGLAHRLRKKGLRVEHQYPIAVYDEDGTQLGQHFADLFINDYLIVEVKAVSRIADEHIAQLLGYLKATRAKDGLLINFGAPKYWIRKFVM